MKTIPPVVIRPATRKDCAACQRLGRVKELAIGPGWFLPIQTYTSFLKENQIFMVATVGKKIVGFSLAERITGRGILLQYMMVAKLFRRHGIGQQLLTATLDEARRRELRWVLAYGVASNPAIGRLLKKSGLTARQLTREYSGGL